MVNHGLTRGAILLSISVAIGAAGAMFGLKNIIESDIKTAVEHSVTTRVYQQCTDRQKATIVSNVRTTALREFVIDAVNARRASSKLELSTGNIKEGLADRATAQKYKDIASRIKRTAYPNCTQLQH